MRNDIDFDDVLTDDDLLKYRIDEKAQHIEQLSQEIARFESYKRQEIEGLMTLLAHYEDGQRTEHGNKYSVTVKRAKNYRLNPAAYNGIEDLPKRLNVVKEVTTQKIDTKKLKEIMRVASEEDRSKVLEYVIETQAAPSATIKVKGW